MKGELLEALVDARSARRSVVLLTWLESGKQRIVGGPQELEGDATLAAAVSEALVSDRASSVETPSGPVFVHPHNPSLRIAIVGAVHIAQHLAALAVRLGHGVMVVDPRTAFASPERFPGVALSHEWPDVALDRFGLDARSAVVTLSHDPKLDDPALERALHSEAFYIGALGSLRTQAKRRERLLAQGFGQEAIARVHGPVGLDLGARSPAEIALSIAAEITRSLRQPSA
ncbi:MAG: XdhC family protein [Deltaproteobacteria bacterium]|nr:XdhC family protein [Deltaproteobacteria bacterium]MBW2496650.1 XdhC family protein [Deltaproteobacteria bacterium]